MKAAREGPGHRGSGGVSRRAERPPGAGSFAALWESLLPIGRDASTGGYRRFSWTAAGKSCREWFATAAEERGMDFCADGNGNLWAWWDVAPQRTAAAPVREDAIVTGSHLDSVPDGGAFDGPLGVVSAFAAIDSLRDKGFTPARPVAVAAFAEEEGARFGVACLGSRLLTGVISPDTARALRDDDGVSLAGAMAQAGADPDLLGPDEELLGRIAAFVELHIEQGRQLAGLDAAIGVAGGIWPHGRWRFEFAGRADHAGTTALTDRRDPMLPFAATVLAARQVAGRHHALSTFGKVSVMPGGVNAIPSAVHAWLDARAPDEGRLDSMVAEIKAAAQRASRDHGVTVSTECESFSPLVDLDPGLRARVSGALAARMIDAPLLRTGAGHDAAVLASRIPAAMLFVRNPSGVSHAPGEHAELADCHAGVAALAAVLEELTSA
ncbi:MAG: allantoate amidohydrolase [Micromonosporaceae bacterium]